MCHSVLCESVFHSAQCKNYAKQISAGEVKFVFYSYLLNQRGWSGVLSVEPLAQLDMKTWKLTVTRRIAP